MVAFHLDNLAELLRVSNRFDEAEPLYRRALAIREESFGPDHPEVAQTLSNLGLLFGSRAAPMRPSRYFAARWRSARQASGRIIPGGDPPQQSRGAAPSHEASPRSRAALPPRASD